MTWFNQYIHSVWMCLFLTAVNDTISSPRQLQVKRNVRNSPLYCGLQIIQSKSTIFHFLSADITLFNLPVVIIPNICNLSTVFLSHCSYFLPVCVCVDKGAISSGVINVCVY